MATAPAGLPFRSQADVAVHLPDLEAAKAFYGGVLGFRLILDQPDKLAFDTGALTLWINRDDRVRSYIPSFAVDDLERTRERLTAAGCTVLRESEDERALYFADPFGLVADVIELPGGGARDEEG
jgi:catechol 2,3-dioxygenase-like lactoylglutathione lyase family enzyme